MLLLQLIANNYHLYNKPYLLLLITKSVTGSCHIIECNGKHILSDYDMFQSDRKLAEANDEAFGFETAADIDYLLIIHAHLDALLAWHQQTGNPQQIYLVHAEEDTMQEFSKNLQNTEVIMQKHNESYFFVTLL